ncbi:hypothetical protein H2200_001973 [Cladophialophora chaetospira]|uniref:Uncharacterized protein n=1 Tax=Cladophialophora chaetospira TaxID=386627 RepID=A0AA39CPJ8_9EURO|nr:hypothetical protein H2200_001973 [Cladophialophora chaetospira]
MPFNLGRVFRLKEDGLPMADPDGIYYIKWTKMHIRQGSIIGPCHHMEQLIAQLLFLFQREDSIQGVELLDKIMSAGEEGDDRDARDAAEAVFFRLEQFEVALPDGTLMKIELFRENNPAVASVLPGDVYGIHVASHPLRYDADEDEDADGIYPPPCAKSGDIYATFKTLSEANKAAEILMKSLRDRAGPDAFIDRLDQDGRHSGHVVVPGSTEVTWIAVIYMHRTSPEQPLIL